jgi:hypothetical protein
MRLLPYLSEDVEDYLIAEETRPRSCINTDDMGAPRNPASADEDLPSYALTLTATNIDGYALIYDTSTCVYSCCSCQSAENWWSAGLLILRRPAYISGRVRR